MSTKSYVVTLTDEANADLPEITAQFTEAAKDILVSEGSNIAEIFEEIGVVVLDATDKEWDQITKRPEFAHGQLESRVNITRKPK